MKERGVRLYEWSADDPLADVFLMQFGEYPSTESIHIDYRRLLKNVTDAKEIAIDSMAPLPADLFDHPSISYISRFGVERHRNARGRWDTPGFFSGDASNFDDLLCCWNLRAADIPLLFVDVKHLERYGETVAGWGKVMREMVSHRRHEFDRRVAVWAREESLDRDIQKAMAEVTKPFSGHVTEVCTIRNGDLNVHPPMMYFGEASTLGAMGGDSSRPRISFSLDGKPSSDEAWFHTQNLVASLSFIGGLYGDEEHTLVPPFVPELNEFYARTMLFQYGKLRSESDRVGLVIDACDKDAFIYALPVNDLMERIFELAGFDASLSAGGLIAS